MLPIPFNDESNAVFARRQPHIASSPFAGTVLSRCYRVHIGSDTTVRLFAEPRNIGPGPCRRQLPEWVDRLTMDHWLSAMDRPMPV